MLVWQPMHLPRFVAGAVLALRRGLYALADAIVPPQLPLLDRVASVEVTAGLAVAAELGLADLLSARPQTAHELATAVGANPDALARLLRALAAQRCFCLGRDGRYHNTRLSDALRRDAPHSLRDFARYQGSPHNLRAWSDFAQTVRDGRSAFERVHGASTWEFFARHPTDGAIFAGAMEELTSNEAEGIAAAFPFDRFRSLCDIGGGHGALASAILRRHPRLRGTLLDDPGTLAGVRERLQSSDVRDRLEVLGGNFFEGVPEGYDLYLLKDVLHDWDDARSLRILENCRRAMRGESRLLIIEILLEPGEARFPGTFADLQMMAVCSEGRQRSRADFEKLLEGAGLQLQRIWRTPRFSSVVEASLRR